MGLKSAWPVVFVIGATGTGKSNLSLKLAKVFKAEILNADSIQLYKGLTIATNKVSIEEQVLTKHHLLSVFDYEEGHNYGIHAYRSDALNIINKLLKSNTTPIVAGGTNYYIESLLYEDFLNKTSSEYELKDRILPRNPDELYNLLKEERPDLIPVLHPNQLRKIRAALQLDPDKSFVSKKPVKQRFSNNIVLWLDTSDAISHEKFIQSRVNKMIELGLIGELDSFIYNAAKTVGKQSNYSEIVDELLEKDETNASQRRGILQTIGFKEFASYLKLTKIERSSTEGETIFQNCVQNMVTVTQKYAKAQKRWIRTRFIPQSAKGLLNLYRFDVSQIHQLMNEGKDYSHLWDTLVTEPSIALVNSHMPVEEQNQELLKSFNPQDFKPDTTISKGIKFEIEGCPPFVCDVCGGRLFYDKHSYALHLKSKLHKKRRNISKRKGESFENENLPLKKHVNKV